MSSLSLTDALSSLTAELCAALGYYAAALTAPCGPCMADISECKARCASLAADTHALLFAAFCPPLPRTQSVVLCETLHEAVEEIFGASMLLTDDDRHGARLDTSAQGLVRMGEMIRREVELFPRLVKSKSIQPPDTYAYHAELTRVRAALALYLMHGERSVAEQLAAKGMAEVMAALSRVYTALLALFAEAL